MRVVATAWHATFMRGPVSLLKLPTAEKWVVAKDVKRWVADMIVIVSEWVQLSAC